MKQFLSVDMDKCTGCRNCEIACAVRNVSKFQPSRSRIQILKDDLRNLIVPMVCLQCDNALCEEACPNGAISENDKGILTVVEDVCIGCHNCVTACIYGGIAVDVVTRKVVKCDLCGGDPACIPACEYKAISLQDSDAKGQQTRLESMKTLWKATGLISEEVQ